MDVLKTVQTVQVAFDPGNYNIYMFLDHLMSVSFTSVPGKVMVQHILETISRHWKDNKIIRSHYVFTKVISDPLDTFL